MSKPRNKLSNLLAIILLTTTIGFVVYLYTQYSLQQKSEHTFYKAFGTSIPRGYKMHGIDVSKYQNYIYWASVKKMKIDSITIDFAFIKATEGVTSIDGMFKRNWLLAHQNNMPCGAYHYFIASKNGEKQAEHFINTVKLTKGDLPPVVDVEDLCNVSDKELEKQLKNFLSIIEKHYKVKPILYSYAEFYKQHLSTSFAQYPLWIAHYTQTVKPEINRNWWFWQHSDAGHVNGITEKVDFNVFCGDSLAFSKILLP